MRTLALGLAAATLAGAAQATLLISTDFDSPGFIDDGVTGFFGPSLDVETAAAGAWNAAGWNGNYLVNRTSGNPAGQTFLELHNLKQHSEITASFVLGFLEGWSGFDGPGGPDALEIYLDGNLVAVLTATNAGGGADEFGGSPIIAYRQQVNDNLNASDTLIGVSQTFAHTSSDLLLQIRATGAGWEGGEVEGWGLDNFELDYVPVPEPGTWALMIGGFGLAGAGLRRRRALAAG